MVCSFCIEKCLYLFEMVSCEEDMHIQSVNLPKIYTEPCILTQIDRTFLKGQCICVN